MRKVMASGSGAWLTSLYTTLTAGGRGRGNNCALRETVYREAPPDGEPGQTDCEDCAGCDEVCGGAGQTE